MSSPFLSSLDWRFGFFQARTGRKRYRAHVCMNSRADFLVGHVEHNIIISIPTPRLGIFGQIAAIHVVVP